MDSIYKELTTIIEESKIKTNEDMSEDVLNKVIEYIKKCILNTNEEQYIINVVGGEISLYNQKLIKKLVSSFDLIRKTKSIKFIYQSNLIYKMSEEIIETIKLIIHLEIIEGISLILLKMMILLKNALSSLN